jgi:hypothetical protein
MKEYNFCWNGMLTIDNVHEVASLFSRLLDGKHYAFVSVNEGCNFKPDVQTGQMLKHVKLASHGFSFRNAYGGSWDCSTTATEDVLDPTFNNPHFSFEFNKVIITHRAPAGHLLYWVAAIEDESVI